MKFSISSKQLQHGLSAVAKVIEKKNAVVILGYAMVSKDGEQFYLTGSSSTTQLTIAFDLRQTDGGAFTPFCLNANQLLAILGTLPEQPIEILVDETQNFLTTVIYDGGDFKLPSMAATDFPVIKRIETAKTAFPLPADVFLPCLKAASLCTAADELRLAMETVVLDTNNEGVTIVGSDGRMMYKYVYDHGVPFLTEGEPTPIMIHRTLVSAIVTAFGKAEQVQVATDGNRTELTADGVLFITNAIEKKYPRYNNVIPHETPYHITVDLDMLTAAVKRVSMMASSASDMLVLTKKNGTVQLLSQDIDFGRSAKAVLPTTDCTMPDGFRIAFKASSLSILLGNVATDDVRMSFVGADKPILLHEAAENSALTELLMPMIINDGENV